MSHLYSAWLMFGLGCALSLAHGGRRSGAHPGEVVTWAQLQTTTKLRENWPEAMTETVRLVLILSGASLIHHGAVWWTFLIAVCALALLPAAPALIHNARITGRVVLPRMAAGSRRS